jgi:hypothetical protein
LYSRTHGGSHARNGSKPARTSLKEQLNPWRAEFFALPALGSATAEKLVVPLSAHFGYYRLTMVVSGCQKKNATNFA